MTSRFDNFPDPHWRKRTLHLLLLFALGVGDVPAQKTSEPVSYTLQETSSSRESIPLIGFWQPVRCDSDGNIYMRVDAGGGLNKSPVWKVSTEGEKLAEFSLPVELAKKLLFAGFYPVSGHLYELAYDQSNTYVLTLGDDGTLISKTVIAAPNGFRPDVMAAFLSGEFFVGGEVRGSTPNPRRYSGVFDANGKLIRALEPPEDNAGEGQQSSKLSPVAATGQDDNVYFLSDTDVEVISTAGKQVRKFGVKAAGGYTPTNLHISGSLVSVVLSKADETHHVKSIFQTYDAATGSPIAQYVPSGLPNAPLCFSAAEGYSFFKVKSGRLEVIHAWRQ